MDNDAYNSLIEECAKCVPSNWLDPLLTGSEAPKPPLDCFGIERLLQGVTARIRAMKQTSGMRET
jgi:hypothetical protein